MKKTDGIREAGRSSLMASPVRTATEEDLIRNASGARRNRRVHPPSFRDHARAVSDIAGLLSHYRKAANIYVYIAFKLLQI